MTTLDKLRKELAKELANAREVHDANRAGGSSEVSVAYDSGRYAGLKQAIEALDRVADREQGQGR